MKGRTPRVWFGFLVVTMVVVLAGAVSLEAQVPGSQPSEQFFKNIQVMKGIPAHLMQATMQLQEIALGVSCAYCHDGGQDKRDLDSKPQKLIARQMMRMVNELNRTQFAGREVVTCFTCHRGSTRPLIAPPYPGEDRRLPTVAAATPPTADQLFDRYTGAVGGAAAIAKAPARTLKGRVTNYGHIVERPPVVVTPLEVMINGPDTRMVIQHNLRGDDVMTYTGTTGWTKEGTEAARDLRPDLADVARLENAVLYPALFTQLLTNLTVEGQEKVGDRTAWVVSGRSAWLPQVKLYFDRDTAYLLSITYQRKSGSCCHVFRVDYDNFYVGGGIRTPLTWTVNGPAGEVLRYDFDSVDTAAIDDARFARP